MASGHTHDRIGVLCGAAIATGLAALVGHGAFSPVGASILFGGYTFGISHLSPDVDTPHSRPSQRWGLLWATWIPYRQTHGHRSRHWQDLLSDWNHRSHWPIVGSAERLLYLSLWLGIAAAIAAIPLWTFAPYQAADLLQYAISGEWTEFYAIAVVFWMGTETASWVHLFCDYFPLLRFL